jgi:uncharacterized protein YcnI
MLKKSLAFLCLTIGSLVFVNTSVYAHVTVKPAEVGVGKYQNFVVSVPVEKENPTVSVKLLIPGGVESVMPNVKPGWKIDTKKIGQGEEAVVSEILWSAGSIPPGQRDEFVFSAKTPATTTTLEWKAYQTYQDGTVVAWDKSSEELKDKKEVENIGPFSQTKIVDDIAQSTATPKSTQENLSSGSDSGILQMVAYASLAISLIALVISLKKKQ